MVRLTKAQLSSVSTDVRLASGNRVVLVDVAGRRDLPLSETNQNVYCLDKMGNVVWQIQAGAATYEQDSFVSLAKHNDGQLCAGRFFGNEFVINPETGIAEHVGWHK